MISIIVPVYNVEAYIDRCLESVVNQTYQDIEILIIEENSTDNSRLKCIEWANKDDRIIIVAKNGGLGPARNYAVNLAKGEFVIFLDSDDWLDYNYVEKMYEIVCMDFEVDMVLSGFYKHNERTGEVVQCSLRWENGIFSGRNFAKEVILFGNNSMWARMIRKSLFQNYGLEQSALPFEDLSLHPALTIAARKIGMCRQTYVHYLAERSGSLMGNHKSYDMLSEVFAWEDQEFHKVSGETSDYDIVRRYYKYKHKLSLHRRYFGDDLSIEELGDEEKVFAELFRIPIILLGGFSSRWIIHRLPNGKDNLIKHFAFSSIISQFSNKCDIEPYEHENAFRKQCIEDDVNKSFISFCTKNSLKPYLVVIDLMNECCDLLAYGRDSFILKSDALMGAKGINYGSKTLLPWQSDDFAEKWKHSCKSMAALLNRSMCKIIIIKEFYSYKYMDRDGMHEYSDIREIKKKNKILEGMYDFLIAELPLAQVYMVPKSLQYTDMQGQTLEPQPEYLNQIVYDKLAGQIELEIIENCNG